MDNCKHRCVDNLHLGSCPSFSIKIPSKIRCRDQCRSDSDCVWESLKCCASSCGRRCVPSVVVSPRDNTCPLGESAGRCSSTASCLAGFTCRKLDENKDSDDDSGICCLDTDVEEINLCQMSPRKLVLDSDSDEAKDSVECWGSEKRYFFNSTSQQCESMIGSGCWSGFNNFPSQLACCETCDRSGKKRCKPGTCPAVTRGLVDSCLDECGSDSECKGTRICCSNGCAKKCMLPQKEMSSCRRRQLEGKRRQMEDRDDSGRCSLVHVPR